MPLKTSAGAGRNFIPPDQGARYATYDLSGQRQKSRELCNRLEQLQPDLQRSLSSCLRRLLNMDSIRVSSTSWTTDVSAQSSWFWLQAFPAGQRDRSVLLGMDRRSMFTLSELFFGGEPEKLTDRQIEKRPLADTERRLGNRLLDTVLRSLCPSLGYALDAWHSDWADSASPGLSGDRYWTELTVKAGDWQLTMQLAWPLSLTGKLQPEPDTDVEAFRSGLRRALMRIRTRLTVEVAAMELPLGELANLRVGDILPLDLASEAPARSGDTDCIRGIICENGDRLALRITRHAGVRHEQEQ